jgi:hypothetical protein
VKVLCIVSTVTCKVSSANRMLEFAVMVAAHKIMHGCTILLVLYCLDMLWIKTVTAKFQYLGSLHYQLRKSCVPLYMGFTTTMHPVYCLKAMAAHIVCPLTGRNQSPSEPQNQVNWNDMRSSHQPLQTTSWCCMHCKTKFTKFPSRVELIFFLWLILHNICKCLATGLLIWADVSRSAVASKPNTRHTLLICKQQLWNKHLWN